MSNVYVFRSSIAGKPASSTASRSEALACPPRSFNHRRSSRRDRTEPPPLARPVAIAEVPALSAIVSKPNKQLMAEDGLLKVVRGRLYGGNKSGLNYAYSSSGSNHAPDSICLADMVNDFFENEGDVGQRVGSCGRTRCNCLDGACGDAELGNSIGNEDRDNSTVQEDNLCEIIEGAISATGSTEVSLLLDVATAMGEEEARFSMLGSATTATSNESGDTDESAPAYASSLLRPVMKRLQQAGYNAAICKSRWNHGDGLPAGDYDYIDVLIEGDGGKQDRIIVDINFKAQFEIARASGNYTKLLNVLPCVFVGRGDRLKQILRIMSSAAKQSLKQQGLHLPPWRKLRYMLAKWFSAYRRTTSPHESSRNRVLLTVNDDTLPGIRIEGRGPCAFTEYTKEMDMAFFRAQAKAIQQSRRVIEKRKEDLALLDAKVGEEVQLVSKQNRPKRVILNENWRNAAATQYPERGMEQVCTAMCTDWQLPPLSEKSCANPRDRVSGLAAVLKQEVSFRAAAPAS